MLYSSELIDGSPLPNSDAAPNGDLLLRRQIAKTDRCLHSESAYNDGRPRISTDLAQRESKHPPDTGSPPLVA
jgi:hypothetical protein